MIRVLSVASECAPLVKTGGLADVVGALPAALTAQGVEMRVLLPAYPQVLAALRGQSAEVRRWEDLMGGTARLLAGLVAGVPVLALDAPHLYDRTGGPYLDASGKDWPDNPERFAALCQVAAQLAQGGVADWLPDVVHGHDWQAGLVPEYMDPMGRHVPFVFTIHNIAFHGNAPADRMGVLGLDPGHFHQGGFEFWGQISALKAGLLRADRLTTVSPTYAEELMTEAFGMGMDGVIRDRRDDFSGILNGIDTQIWDPATDPQIAPFKTPRGKSAAKAALRAEFGLPEGDGPLCVVVSRLSEQKGLDLLAEALPTLLDRGGQLALLGAGDKGLEQQYRDLAAAHDNVAVHIGYDEGMAHRLMAGGDAILVPSRFEPCGLTQLYGLRYGTVPLVALTGGLADTVINASPAALDRGVATGIQFHPVTATALTGALMKLCALYQQPKVWAKLQRNAMAQPVGWETSAAAYAALYADVTTPH